MSLIGGDFLQLLRQFRLGWMGGRPGGGKTSLAVRLAIEFMDRGWVKDAVGNFPSVVFTDLARLPDCRDCFIILDEAGVWLNDKEFDKVTAYMRKRNLYVILSSVLPVALRARTLNIQRVINGHGFGANVWLYRGKLDYMNVKEQFNLIWRNPREVWGLFDTGYVASDGDGIIEWVNDAFRVLQHQKKDIGHYSTWAREFAGVHGLAAGSRAVEIEERDDSPDLSSGAGLSEMEDIRRLTETIAWSAEKFDDAVSLAKRKRRR